MSAEPGFEPQVVSTWVNHITNMPIGMRHDWMALDVVFIGACNLRKSARRKKNLCILQIFINDKQSTCKVKHGNFFEI